MMLSTIRRHGVPAARCRVSPASLFPRNEVFSQRSRSTGNKKERTKLFDKFAALDDNERAASVLDLEPIWEIVKNQCPVEVAWMMNEKVGHARRAEKVKERSADNKRKYPTVAEEWKSFENLRTNYAEWQAKFNEASEFDNFETMNQNERASYVLELENTCKRMEIDSPEECATTDEKKAELRTEKIKQRSADNKCKHATIEEEWAIRSFEAKGFEKFAVLDRNERAAYILDLEKDCKQKETICPEEFFARTDEKRAERRAEKVKQRSTDNKHKYATIDEEWKSFENNRAKKAEWERKLIETIEFDHFKNLDQNERATYVMGVEISWKLRESLSPEEYGRSIEKMAESRAEKIKKRVADNKRKYVTLEEEWNSFENLRTNIAEWVARAEEEEMSLAAEEARYSWYLYVCYMMMFSGCCGACVVMGSL